jgi:hypothetical protein
MLVYETDTGEVEPREVPLNARKEGYARNDVGPYQNPVSTKRFRNKGQRGFFWF